MAMETRGNLRYLSLFVLLSRDDIVNRIILAHFCNMFDTASDYNLTFEQWTRHSVFWYVFRLESSELNSRLITYPPKVPDLHRDFQSTVTEEHYHPHRS